MPNPSPRETLDALAVEICGHSGRHTAGYGDHNAELYGACSQCLHYARVVQPLLAAAEARGEERGRDEAARAVVGPKYMPANPYRTALTGAPVTSPPVIEVEQVQGNGYVVRCSVHGVLRPEPGKVWASHVTASFAATAHAAFVFHGRGAR